MRIPKTFASEAKLAEDSPVELSLEEGRLVVTPVPRKRRTLAELLAQVTDDNIHPEVDWGPPVGKEVW